MNILVVVSDTLRRDYLSFYKKTNAIAPNLEDFAQQSIVFDRCYPASFPTVPARSDLMTGRYTFTYLPWGPLPQGEITLPDCMTKAGYTTTGIADTPFFVRNGYGHDRGFSDFYWIRGQRSGLEHDDVARNRHSEEDYFAPMTFATAIDWISNHHDEKFFLYVDTWDPHEPWDPPDHYVKQYLPEYSGEVVEPCYWYWREDGYSERDLEIARACYMGEITMVDVWFGKLVDRMRELNLLDNTAIIFVSDHGFYFGEHGLFGKRRFRWPGNKYTFEEGWSQGLKVEDQTLYRSPLYNELIRVPFLARIPGIEGKRIKSLVSLPDIMPTVLDLAGVPVPRTVQAKSLVKLMHTGDDGDSPNEIVVVSAPLEVKGEISRTVDDKQREIIEISPCTLVTDDWVFLYAAEGQPVELYARGDEEQKTNVAEANPEIVRHLHEKYVDFLSNADTPKAHMRSRIRL